MVTHYNENNIYGSSIQTKGIKKIISDYGYWKRSRIILKLKKFGSLLDIGCGTGDFVKYIASNTSFDVTCTEININNVNDIKKSYDINAKYGFLTEINFPTNHFDVITIWDVLEHIQNPKKLLVEIRRILKPNGILIIRIPNGDSIDFKIFGKYWAGLDAPRHYYTFSTKSITELLNNSGFIIKSRQTNIGGYLNLVTSISFLLNSQEINSKVKNIILKFLRGNLPQLLFFPITGIKNLFFQGTSLTVVAESHQD
jgi:ubiquinone/menaquinone biosynthesis C-methylase UbiE